MVRGTARGICVWECMCWQRWQCGLRRLVYAPRMAGDARGPCLECQSVRAGSPPPGAEHSTAKPASWTLCCGAHGWGRGYALASVHSAIAINPQQGEHHRHVSSGMTPKMRGRRRRSITVAARSARGMATDGAHQPNSAHRMREGCDNGGGGQVKDGHTNLLCWD
eukprot:COSAG01_NODE_699_length_14176_cov_21.100590_19_plen_165_part_00